VEKPNSPAIAISSSLRQENSSICTLNGQFPIHKSGVVAFFNRFLMHRSVDAACIFISGLWHLLHPAKGLLPFCRKL
jgi:hypothetical protein